MDRILISFIIIIIIISALNLKHDLICWNCKVMIMESRFVVSADLMREKSGVVFISSYNIIPFPLLSFSVLPPFPPNSSDAAPRSVDSSDLHRKMRTFVVPVRCSWNLEKKNQIHLRFVFVNGKKEIRETRGERERDVWICGKIGSWNSLREGERESA
jgi:hypothetical protein